jgi:hypothetical protein
LGEQLNVVDTGRWGFGRGGRFGSWQLGIENGINGTGLTLELSVKVDIELGKIQRIKANLDAFAGKFRRGLVKTAAQQEGGVFANGAIDAMEEGAMQVSGWGELSNLFDIVLPAQQRGGMDCRMLAAVIVAVNPGPESIIEFFEG